MAYLYSNANRPYTAINVPNAVNNYVYGVNDANCIGYTWPDSGGTFHRAALLNNKYVTFDDPDGTETYADGINNKSVVVGDFPPAGQQHNQSFKLTATK